MNNNITANFNSNNANNNNHLVGQKEFQEYHPYILGYFKAPGYSLQPHTIISIDLFFNKLLNLLKSYI